MRTSLLAVLAVVAALMLGAVPARAQQAGFPGYVIPNSQLRVLPVTGKGRHYQLYVGLPASYGEKPGKRYPVVYVTDGYWDFAKMTTIGGALVYDKVVPEFITIGLGYAGEDPDYDALRLWELAPVRIGGSGRASGHAEDFLQTLKSEVIPLVDADYRTDTSYRVLAGSSLGGLFTLYVMMTSPDLFQAYIAGTPAAAIGDDWLFDHESRFARTPSALEGRRLFMTVGEHESPTHINGVIRFHRRLESRLYPGFDYQFRMIEGERHAGVQIESYTRGLRHAFRPRAPETGPMRDRRPQ